MDKAYDDVVDRIRRDRNNKRAIEILSWLLYGLEPISANGIRHALAVDLEDKAFFESDLVPESLLLSSCKGLVSIGQEGGLLHPSHETVHKYLKKHENVLFSNCHTVLAEKCLIYLSQREVPRKAKGEGTSFFEYASRNWGSHVRMAGSDNRMSKVANAFMSDHTKLSRSVKCISLLQSRVAYHPVHILAHFDLREMFEQQIGTDGSRELLRDAHGRTTLFFAAEANSLAVVELLLSRGVVDKSIIANLVFRTDIESINQHAVLADATKMVTRNDVVEALLVRGADVSSCKPNGSTALHCAAETGNCKSTQLLLLYNANPNVLDIDGMTPLHLACKNGSSANVRQLVPVMADLNGLAIQGDRGVTALYLAEQNGFRHITEYLRQRNAESVSQPNLIAQPAVDRTVSATSPTRKDRQRAFQFVWAAQENKLDLMQRIEREGIDIEVRGYVEDLTALHKAAYYGHQRILQWLLGLGANVNTRDSFNRTPLFHACITNDLGVVDILLNHGADPDVLDINATRPFETATNEEIRRLLRERSSAIEHHDHNLSDLHRAVRANDVDEVGRILDREDNDPLSPLDGDGNTPLHYAAINGLYSVISRMVSACVDLDQGNRYGQTALDAAVSRRAFHKAESDVMRHIVELLGWEAFRCYGALDFVHRIGPEFDKVPLHWAAETGNLAQVELLLTWGSDPDRQDIFGETPLHYAAERGHVEVAERLIPVSAPGRLDKQGFTPLRKARERNKAETVKLMLPFWTEADVSATDACKKSFKDWDVELRLYNAEAGRWKDLPWGTGGPPVLE
ncbi:hypothetical protein SLS58_003830 [Diplodia intermedia]|uniref:GPI inositol-deacylase winged helix domain-containing protein n=1 Tax=Diplodia intermedia TaxID=856260 RepID=A0ABR3TW08_9PEZI